MQREVLIGCGLTAVLWCASAQAQTNIDARAEKILRSACEYLAETPHFSFNAEIWREHVEESGQKIQFTRTMDLQVKRPRGLHVEIHSPHTQRGFWYNGNTLTELDRKRNLYSTMPISGTIDAALDSARDEFGIDLPLIDLAISDPYKNAIEKVQTGVYFGMASAMGFECHHLAFTQENVDWQVWIQDGPQPLIRKFVITHKNEPGAPEFTALIKQWDLANRIAASDFVFDPPTGAVKVEMIRNGAKAANPHASKGSEPLTTPKQKS